MDPTYRNLTAVFTVGTVILWCLTNFLLTCDPDLDVAEQRNSYGKGAENKQGAVPITDDPSAREWLKSKLVESPKHRNMSSSSCRSTHGESHAAPFAAIAAVGELHLNLDVQGRRRQIHSGRRHAERHHFRYARHRHDCERPRE
ncbi:hypothetical protein EMCRGX_G032547 [Ephydatia muelleri]